MKLPLEKHPCFNDKSRHQFGRIHLPVAPKCNIQCNFCNRKYDCLNENRPGVTSKVLSPEQALHYLGNALEISPNISVVGIAGPGDPFANPVETMKTLRLVREKYPEMLLCVATNGLNVLPYIDELAELEVSHVTITINAVSPKIGAEVYAWVRHQKRVLRDEQAAEQLLENQIAALKKLKEVGITAKVNTIIIPSINDHHVLQVAKTVSDLGADILNTLPYYQNEGTVFENIPEPHPELVKQIQEEAGKFLPQMKHCARCRADAVGVIGEENTYQMMVKLDEASKLSINLDEKRKYVAVTSMEGVLINQHLGEADRFLIYDMKSDGSSCKLIGSRPAPRPGGGNKRWDAVSEVLFDCKALFVGSAGETPKKALGAKGLQVLVMEGVIDEAVSGFFKGKDLRHLMRTTQMRGTGCSGGAGVGCG